MYITWNIQVRCLFNTDYMKSSGNIHITKLSRSTVTYIYIYIYIYWIVTKLLPIHILNIDVCLQTSLILVPPKKNLQVIMSTLSRALCHVEKWDIIDSINSSNEFIQYQTFFIYKIKLIEQKKLEYQKHNIRMKYVLRINSEINKLIIINCVCVCACVCVCVCMCMCVCALQGPP